MLYLLKLNNKISLTLTLRHCMVCVICAVIAVKYALCYLHCRSKVRVRVRVRVRIRLNLCSDCNSSGLGLDLIFAPIVTLLLISF
jgi:hypothetical protein